ncbi:transglutaminase-like domain-containing protein [Rubellimicrobium roseum]|uniref:Transglutaminase family protein n=1 Tax=Rubellimicrobium roseum TaxID=687525 RepID=A0A5C4N8W5_9RHOB|nr:transglutaminase family protein [Rubellimicrobium roseum]TNC59122.1 transglutaminase family protein [Rubellimicrobium roseum]
MLIRVAFDVTLTASAPTPVILALSPHPNEMHRVSAGPLVVGPNVPVHWYTDPFGNRRGRLVAPEGDLRLTWKGLATDNGRPDDVNPVAEQHPVQDLPDEVLQFLQASRYCESDLLSQEAWDRFGHVPTGWGKVQAICDFVHEAMTFDYKDASSVRTAHSSLKEGKAVCRDFAHLVIAFARALNIPARYVSGYLGDIDWPDHGPGDFCAWTEVFLGGRWYTFDARYNVPRIGRIVMVRGRDAGDVPMITSFGSTTLKSFQVWCDEVKTRVAAE